MILHPNAKINLGLYITSRRPDGYHNLSTLFYPIPLCDNLEIEPADSLTLECAGALVEGENIILKAYRAVAARYDIPPVAVRLEKLIPMGAGLGGGSADAAFMVRGLNHLFGLGMDADEMERLLAPIGADCPFFVRNIPQYAAGIGNEFSPCDLSLKGWHIMVVKPDTFVSTREAYAGVHPHAPQTPIHTIIESGVEAWRNHLHNDFEDSIFPLHPEIAEVKQALYDMGAVYAAMSGSGAAVFGLFRQKPHLLNALCLAGMPFAECFELSV